MFFLWNIKKLKHELIVNGMSQKTLFLYVLLYVAASQLVSEPVFMQFADAPLATIDYIQAVINLLVVAIATALCFYANGANAGQQFAERYFSISFVIALRFLAVSIPLLFLLGACLVLLEPILGWEVNGPESDYAMRIFISIAMLVLYWRVIKHINDVAKAQCA